jgi:hypothetical protein
MGTAAPPRTVKEAAQAEVKGLRLVTRDPVFEPYGVEVLEA